MNQDATRVFRGKISPQKNLNPHILPNPNYNFAPLKARKVQLIHEYLIKLETKLLLLTWGIFMHKIDDPIVQIPGRK